MRDQCASILVISGRSRPSRKGGGGGHSDPEIWGGWGAGLKKHFPALRDSAVWSKSKGRGGLLGFFSGSATGNSARNLEFTYTAPLSVL